MEQQPSSIHPQPYNILLLQHTIERELSPFNPPHHHQHHQYSLSLRTSALRRALAEKKMCAPLACTFAATARRRRTQKALNFANMAGPIAAYSECCQCAGSHNSATNLGVVCSDFVEFYEQFYRTKISIETHSIDRRTLERACAGFLFIHTRSRKRTRHVHNMKCVLLMRRRCFLLLVWVDVCMHTESIDAHKHRW